MEFEKSGTRTAPRDGGGERRPRPRGLRPQGNGRQRRNMRRPAPCGEPTPEYAVQRSAETAPQAMSAQLASLNRKTLLDLRDSLRSLLTALESE